MKLKDILEVHIEPNVSDVTARNNADTITQLAKLRRAQTSRDTSLGKGSFARVSTNPRGIDADNQARKMTTEVIPFMEDPYFLYVKKIVYDHLAESNPYFPRIYGLKIIRDKDDPAVGIYHVNMEKLLTYADISPDDLIHVMRQLLGKNFQPFSEGYDINPELSQSRLMNKIMTIIAYTFNKIEDEDFKRAWYVIKTIESENPGFGLDIHDGNFMFRRTSVGVQLVIIDPLYNRHYHDG